MPARPSPARSDRQRRRGASSVGEQQQEHRIRHQRQPRPAPAVATRPKIGVEEHPDRPQQVHGVQPGDAPRRWRLRDRGIGGWQPAQCGADVRRPDVADEWWSRADHGTAGARVQPCLRRRRTRQQQEHAGDIAHSASALSSRAAASQSDHRQRELAQVVGRPHRRELGEAPPAGSTAAATGPTGTPSAGTAG